MWPELPSIYPRTAFPEPVPPPAVEPDAAPLCTVTINETWLGLMCGALNALLPDGVWASTDPAVVLLAQKRTLKLLDMLAVCQGAAVRLAPNPTLQASPDAGASWLPVVAFSVIDSLAAPLPLDPGVQYLSNGAVSPFIFNSAGELLRKTG